jgi:hypothetical protein
VPRCECSGLGKLQMDLGDGLGRVAGGLSGGSRCLLDHQLSEQGVDAGEGGRVSSHGDHLGWEEQRCLGDRVFIQVLATQLVKVHGVFVQVLAAQLVEVHTADENFRDGIFVEILATQLVEVDGIFIQVFPAQLVEVDAAD